VSQDNPVRVVEAFVDQLDLRQMGFDGVAQRRPSALPTTRRLQFDLLLSFETVKRGRTITDQRAGDLPPAERLGCLMTDRVKVDVRRSGRRFEAIAELDLEVRQFATKTYIHKLMPRQALPRARRIVIIYHFVNYN
jgi:hypothetical protein